MKKKSKRYYGMTMSQIQILAGAAVGGLLIIGILLVFLLMPASNLAVPQAAETKAATPTKTPAPTIASETDTPTVPPVIATKIPPAGWVEFKTQGATLWLPGNFVGGDMAVDRQNTIAKITKLGRYYKNIISSMKNASEETVMWMVDKKPEQTDIITSVIMGQKSIPEDTNLDEYIKNDLASDSNGTPTSMLITVNQTKKLKVLGREARRLTISQMFAGHEANGLIYFVKDQANLWMITYIFSTKQYIEILASADESIQTFNLTP